MIYFYLWVVFMFAIMMTVWSSGEMDKQRREMNKKLDVLTQEVMELRLKVTRLECNEKGRRYENLH